MSTGRGPAASSAVQVRSSARPVARRPRSFWKAFIACPGLRAVGATGVAAVVAGRPEQALGDADRIALRAAVQRPVVGPVGDAAADGRRTTRLVGRAEVHEVPVDGQPDAAVRRAHVQRVLVHPVVGPPAGRPDVLAPGHVPAAVRPGEPDPVRRRVGAVAALLADHRDAGADAGVDPRQVAGAVQLLGPGRQEVQRRLAARAVADPEPLQVVPERAAAAEPEPAGGRPGTAGGLDPLGARAGVAAVRAGVGLDPPLVGGAARLRADPDRQQPPALPGLVLHPAAGQVALGARAQRAADVDAGAQERGRHPPAVHHRARRGPARVEGVAGPAVDAFGGGPDQVAGHRSGGDRDGAAADPVV